MSFWNGVWMTLPPGWNQVTLNFPSSSLWGPKPWGHWAWGLPLTQRCYLYPQTACHYSQAAEVTGVLESWRCHFQAQFQGSLCCPCRQPVHPDSAPPWSTHRWLPSWSLGEAALHYYHLCMNGSKCLLINHGSAYILLMSYILNTEGCYGDDY